jgi:hypothetical protein
LLTAFVAISSGESASSDNQDFVFHTGQIKFRSKFSSIKEGENNMSYQNREISYCTWQFCLGLSAATLLALTGCSASKPPEKPLASARAQEDVEPSSKPFASASVNQASSLDQLQQGKTVGTDRSSPLKGRLF